MTVNDDVNLMFSVKKKTKQKARKKDDVNGTTYANNLLFCMHRLDGKNQFCPLLKTVSFSFSLVNY